MEDEREILIGFRPRNDFEKLLFAQVHIKEQNKLISSLRIEIGMLKSEIDEIEDTHNLAKKNKLLKQNIRGLEKKNRSLEAEITRFRNELKKITK